MENNLNQKYEMKIRPYIDVIDSLRSLGIKKDLTLPAITVIGDQGSGKSSVLEALSGVDLPKGNGIVTRCPLKLKLRKGENNCNWYGQISYRDVKRKLKNPSEVKDELVKAQNSIAGTGVEIHEDLISLEIISPNVSDLTLIDLPGITRVAVGNQPNDIGEKIKKLIKKYIQKEETINLVVIPCNVDIATIEALEMARKMDPNGERTLGILTKPDLVDRGAENAVMTIMKNIEVPLSKGYMIVKCRGQQDIDNDLTMEDAMQKEKSFFKTHKYFSSLLNEGKATIPVLAETLTNLLMEHICKFLPDLTRQINTKLQEVMKELDLYEESIPESEDAIYAYLLDKIRTFTQEILNIAKGEEKLLDENTPRLFRIVRIHFEKWQNNLDDSKTQLGNTLQDKLMKFDNLYRGRELLGFINYQTFEMIVRDRIRQLQGLALENLKSLIGTVENTFLKYCTTHFDHFPNLNTAAKTIIEDLRRIQEEEAENMIKTHFKMEQHLYAQDKVYSQELLKVQKQVATTSKRTANNLELVTIYQPQITEIECQVKAYYEGAVLRLSTQIPMIINFCALQEYGDKVEKKMFQILQETGDFSRLLKERPDLMKKRKEAKDRMERLSQAHSYLMNFPGAGLRLFASNFFEASLVNGINKAPCSSSTADLPFSIYSESLANSVEELHGTQPTATQPINPAGDTNTSILNLPGAERSSSSSSRYSARHIKAPLLKAPQFKFDKPDLSPSTVSLSTSLPESP